MSDFNLTKAYALDVDTKAIKLETDKISAEVIKTTAIKSKTDNLPINPASQTNIDLIKTESDKIPATIVKVDSIKSKTDNLPSTPANEATLTTILAELVEVEKHLHSNECWYGKASVPVSEINEADKNSLTTFQVDSGNNDFGTAICVLGTSDTPCLMGKTKFDFHKLLITNTERTNEPYIIRWAWGNTEAEALAAGTYSSTAYYPTATIRSAPVEVQGRRITAGTKVWMNCKCANNTGTLNFLFGFHEYDV